MSVLFVKNNRITLRLSNMNDIKYYDVESKCLRQKVFFLLHSPKTHNTITEWSKFSSIVQELLGEIPTRQGRKKHSAKTLTQTIILKGDNSHAAYHFRKKLVI